MSESDSKPQFGGSVPEIYDRLMVPMVFAGAAELLAQEIQARRPSTILEVAAGTGVLTQALLVACPQAEVVATDLSQPMLDRASERVGVDARLRFEQADALELPFVDSAFDVVACQFGVMFFPDRVRGYREAGRVLRRGGALVFNVWDSLETNDFARITTSALQQLSNAPMDFMSHLPHGYFDRDVICGDLRDAGFDVSAFDPVDATSVATATDAAVALCQGTPMRSQIEAAADLTLDQATDAARAALESAYGPGVITGRIRSFQVVAKPR